MKKNLLNLSGKIDSLTIELLHDVSAVAESLTVPFFVIGATARDILLSYGHGIKTTRITMDVDFGIQVLNWDQYKEFKKQLLSTGKFSKTKEEQRLRYHTGHLIDIVPFGAIIDKDGFLFWPPEQKTKMSILGFSESYENSVIVRLKEEPVLDIPFASLPGLAIMKLISWDERYPERKKDAEDLILMLCEYLSAGNQKRLFNTEMDIIDSLKEGSGFDYEKASAKLLGRDMAKIMGDETRKKIILILEKETGEKDRYRLVEDMNNMRIRSALQFERALELLEELKSGVVETGS
jgi:predicted nucleotidyltransferase